MTHDSTNKQKTTEQKTTEHSPRNPPEQLKPIASADLLQGRRELQILHGNEVYRLTLTRTGKLILHK
ncbi:MAG: hemin uptake protein HemP [Pirellulales bacterium]|jgi:hemin uptake protein HemP|nr:hemin uptake protein HemP [Pirellulales bacterium]MDO7689247.1 hemin uptake protein HemP [Pirellulales bacterium]